MGHNRIDRVGGQHSTTKMRFITKAFPVNALPLQLNSFTLAHFRPHWGRCFPSRRPSNAGNPEDDGVHYGHVLNLAYGISWQESVMCRTVTGCSDRWHLHNNDKHDAQHFPPISRDTHSTSLRTSCF